MRAGGTGGSNVGVGAEGGNVGRAAPCSGVPHPERRARLSVSAEGSDGPVGNTLRSIRRAPRQHGGRPCLARGGTFTGQRRLARLQEGDCAAQPHQDEHDDDHGADDQDQPSRCHQYELKQQVAPLEYTRIRMPCPKVKGPAATWKSAP